MAAPGAFTDGRQRAGVISTKENEMSKKKAKHDLPRTVFVQRYIDDDSGYLLVDATEESALKQMDLGHRDAGECVGVYELKEVVKLTAGTTYKRERIG